MGHKLWDWMAKSYDRRFGKMYRPLLKAILPLLMREDKVLELGCGSGLVSMEVIPLVSEFVGCDISQEMVAIAQQKYMEWVQHAKSPTTASFLRCDAKEVPNLREYSKILAINLLHVVKSPDKLLFTIKERLSEDAELIVVSFCHGAEMGPKFRLLSWLMAVGAKLGLLEAVTPFTYQSLQDLICQAGFSIKKARFDGDKFPFALIVASRDG